MSDFAPAVQINNALRSVRFAMHDFDNAQTIEAQDEAADRITDTAIYHRMIVRKHLRLVKG